jgi:thiamine pyridinylase
MRHKIKLFALSFMLLSMTVIAQSNRRQLTVSLYPFIPNADNLYRKIEMQFEKQNPDIDLVVNLNADYYDETSGLISEEADIYELDCILLKDFVKKGKIQSLQPDKFLFQQDDLMPASNIVYLDKKLFAIPHWLCGNFLFYNSLDSAMNNIKKLSDLEKVIGINPNLRGGLLIDLKGKLTLGELYADALFDQYKDVEVVKKYISISNLDKSAIDNLNRLPKMTFSNWGRIDDYHNKIGFYQKQFAKANGRAFVGYSESLFYILDEINNSCYNEEGCITNNQISIAEFPLSENGSTQAGWVDALALDSKLKGQKLNDATTFINFLISKESYHTALIPDYGNSPRYLLPAYNQLYSDSVVLQSAPYYQQLYPLALKIISFTENGISPELRQIGKKLDKEYLEN